MKKRRGVAMKVFLSIIICLCLIGYSTILFASNNPFLSAGFWKRATHDDVIQMIHQGYDVNDTAEYDLTPLMLASTNNADSQIIKTLLKNGAVVNAQSTAGWTPLMFASAHNTNSGIIIELLDNGARINDQDVEGLTPLMIASAYNRAEIVSILLNNGAKIQIKDKAGKTALDYAKGNPHLFNTKMYRQMEYLLHEYKDK